MTGMLVPTNGEERAEPTWQLIVRQVRGDMRQRQGSVPKVWQARRPRWRRLLANQLERLVAPLAPRLIPY